MQKVGLRLANTCVPFSAFIYVDHLAWPLVDECPTRRTEVSSPAPDTR
jgi:hypothetical protein